MGNDFIWAPKTGLSSLFTLECFYCGIELKTDDLSKKYANDGATVDHKDPVSKFGSELPSNKVDACRKCNSEKNDRSLEDYRQWLIVQNELNTEKPAMIMGLLGCWTSGQLRRNPSPMAVLFGMEWLFPGELKGKV